MNEAERIDIYSEALADIRALCQLGGSDLEKLGQLARIGRITTAAVEEIALGSGV